jgi:hypothetical protein
VLVSVGCSSYPPSAFGRPAFGWHETQVVAARESDSITGRISRAPTEQLTPTISGRACSIEIQNASTV